MSNNTKPPIWGSAQWNSIHGDSRNSDAVPYPISDRYTEAWTALDGAAILFGPAISAEGRLYLCSGRGEGHSHLHALDRQGNILWESDPQSGHENLDSRASPYAPLLGDDGAVYVGGQTKFWCFEQDGSPRWKTDLPGLGATESFASSIFTREGHVGGVTLDGKVVLLRPEDGQPAVPVLQLPHGICPQGPPPPPGLWQNGLMDAGLIKSLYPAFFGFDYQVTNSPSVNPENGYIYISGAGERADQSVLYGLRLAGDGVEIAFTAPFEGRCATTSSISPDGEQVYAGNSNGHLHAFDANSGKRIWTYEKAGPAASPTIGFDGTVYTGTNTRKSEPSMLSALDPETGEIKWCQHYDALAAELLPSRAVLDPFFPEATPSAVINSVQTVNRDRLLVVLLLGYKFIDPSSGTVLTQPHRSVLASIDLTDGRLRGYTELRDTSEAAIVVDREGAVYVCHAALLSSVFFYGINSALPESHRTSLRPSGGLTALQPIKDEITPADQ